MAKLLWDRFPTVADSELERSVFFPLPYPEKSRRPNRKIASLSTWHFQFSLRLIVLIF